MHVTGKKIDEAVVDRDNTDNCMLHMQVDRYLHIYAYVHINPLLAYISLSY